MLRAIVFAAAIGGVAAGALVSVAQSLHILPLIHEAETYESTGAHGHGHSLDPAATPGEDHDLPAAAAGPSGCRGRRGRMGSGGWLRADRLHHRRQLPHRHRLCLAAFVGSWVLQTPGLASGPDLGSRRVCRLRPGPGARLAAGNSGRRDGRAFRAPGLVDRHRGGDRRKSWTDHPDAAIALGGPRRGASGPAAYHRCAAARGSRRLGARFPRAGLRRGLVGRLTNLLFWAVLGLVTGSCHRRFALPD